MSRLIYVLVGFLFVSGGVLTAVYIMVNKAEEKSVENNAYPFEERLKIAEELLSQSSKKSSQKALLLFTELSSKSVPAALSCCCIYLFFIDISISPAKVR